MDPVTLMSIAANLATFFSFGGDVSDRLSDSFPPRYTDEEIGVWREVINSINFAESNLLNEIKGDEYRRLISDLASERLKFNSLVSSLHGADLTAKIDEFIVQLETKNFEFNFVNLLNSTFHGHKSFLQVIIERIKANNANRDESDVKSPPQKVLYEFYLSVAEKIGEANILHRFAFAKKRAIQGTLDSTDFKYIDNTLTTAIVLLKTVIGSAFDNFKAMDNRIYVPHFADDLVIKNSILFSLHPIRVKAGHVVTGARFIQENNVVHLQLQSAKLLPLGLIDKTTIAWERFKKTDHNYLEVVDVALTSLTGSFVDQDIALTGVKLFYNTAEGMESGILSLRIIGRRFDFETGQLGLDEISKNLTENPTERSTVAWPSLSHASFSLEAPLAAVNIMKIRGTISDQYTPVAVSLDYRRLLKLNVVPEMQQQSHLISSAVRKTSCPILKSLLLSLIFYISCKPL